MLLDINVIIMLSSFYISSISITEYIELLESCSFTSAYSVFRCGSAVCQVSLLQGVVPGEIPQSQGFSHSLYISQVGHARAFFQVCLIPVGLVCLSILLHTHPNYFRCLLYYPNKRTIFRSFHPLFNLSFFVF